MISSIKSLLAPLLTLHRHDNQGMSQMAPRVANLWNDEITEVTNTRCLLLDDDTPEEERGEW